MHGAFLGIKEAGEYLDLEYKTVHRLVRSVEIPAAKIGGVYRIRRADLDAYFEMQKQRTALEIRRALCDPEEYYQGERDIVEKWQELLANGDTKKVDMIPWLEVRFCRQAQDGDSVGCRGLRELLDRGYTLHPATQRKLVDILEGHLSGAL
jgi:excisionase family DNA binding protein